MTKRRFGQILIGAGLVTIFVAVIYVLEEANGPGTGPKSFAERRGYDQVKESVHQTFPLAFAVGIGGLGLIMLGTRMTRRTGEKTEGEAKAG
jgi:hypothetical protein